MLHYYIMLHVPFSHLGWACFLFVFNIKKCKSIFTPNVKQIGLRLKEMQIHVFIVAQTFQRDGKKSSTLKQEKKKFYVYLLFNSIRIRSSEVSSKDS